MAEKEFDVITAGDVFIDIVMSGFARWPRPGEESFAGSFHREAGGGAAITAAGLARLGLRAGLFAIIGRDGEWLRLRLSQCGVRLLETGAESAESAGLTVSVSTAEDRAFFTYQGANRLLPAALSDIEASIRLLSAARHVHLAFAIPPSLLTSLARGLHAGGTTISVDVGWQTGWLTSSDTPAALREVDLFLPNEREAELMTGETGPEAMLAAFAEMGLQHVALKLGAFGSASLKGGTTCRAEPVAATTVDTTGAGDCFDAGYIHAWLSGEPPENCLREANLCGALSTRFPGGIDGFPTLEELVLHR